MEQLKKLLLVGFAVFLRPGSVGQLTFGLIVALLHFMAHVECRPYVHDADDSLAGAFSFNLVFFFSCLMIFKNHILVEAVGPILSDYVGLLYITDTKLLSIAMVLALVAGLLISSLVVFLQMNESARSTRRTADTERAAAAARGRMSNPPTCDWKLKEGNEYLAFLSHFKVEAGSDARCTPPAPHCPLAGTHH